MDTNSFIKLRTLVEDVETDAVKFFVKGNKTAGVRLRKVMQEIRNAAKGVREEVIRINQTN